MAHILPNEFMNTCSDGTMSCFAQWAYTVTNGIFWVFALLGFCVAVFLATLRLGNNRAFAFAGFVAVSGAIWFSIMGLMSWWLASAFILVGLLGMVVAINSR